MTTQRQEFSADDAAPIVLYAKDNADSKFAFPLTRDMFGAKMQIPTHDRIQLVYTSGLVTGITYSASGGTVAVIGITYSSGLISDVIRTT